MDRALLTFLAVAEEGNLTAAADRVGLTQPALTRSLREWSSVPSEMAVKVERKDSP